MQLILAGFIAVKARKIDVSPIKNYKLDVNLVSLGNKKLRHTFRGRKPVDKHDNCNVCTKLPQQYKCDKPGVVYQFKCSFCFSTYIGKTSRPFYLRYNEHKNSIKNKNNNSALSDHTKVCDCSSIDDFDINFLRCASDPVDLSLHESRLIDFLKPALNRRHEGAGGGPSGDSLTGPFISVQAHQKKPPAGETSWHERFLP